MAIYLIDGRNVSSDAPELEALITPLHGTKVRPVCLCRDPGGEMYVAKVNHHFILKRMPNSGAAHSPSCDSYDPPPELSGLGQVLGTAIEEDLAGGTTLLKLDFSLSKSGHRNMPVPSGKESDTVSSNGSKLTLRGVLHYLWGEAGFNRWSPAMHNKRNWFVIRKHLLHSAENKAAKGMDMGDILYIPEDFKVEKRDEITQRRQSHLMRISAPEKGTRRLMVVIGEVKEIVRARYGMKVVVKHLPDFPFQISDDLHARLERRFNLELSLWNAHAGSHLIIIATFGVNPVGVANLEEVALMVVTENWIPFENAYDHLLLNTLTNQRRRFMRGLRYNMPQSRPLAVALLTDIEPNPAALYIIPIGASQEFIDEQNKLIEESELTSWIWDATTGAMPPLPAAHVEAQPTQNTNFFDKPLFDD